MNHVKEDTTGMKTRSGCRVLLESIPDEYEKTPTIPYNPWSFNWRTGTLYRKEYWVRKDEAGITSKSVRVVMFCLWGFAPSLLSRKRKDFSAKIVYAPGQ